MHNKLFFLIFTLFCIETHAQEADTTFTKFLTNKTIPSGMVPEFCIALSYYPELINAKVVVKQKNINCTMMARPSFGSYFKRKSNRTYLLIIDTVENDKPGLFDDLYFNARVGLIGHELAHLADYSQRGFLGMLSFGVGYIFNKRKIEQLTDEITISRGLGWQLHDYARIAFDPEKVSQQFYKRKVKYYYTPQQLEELIYRKPAP